MPRLPAVITGRPGRPSPRRAMAIRTSRSFASALHACTEFRLLERPGELVAYSPGRRPRDLDRRWRGGADPMKVTGVRAVYPTVAAGAARADAWQAHFWQIAVRVTPTPA